MAPAGDIERVADALADDGWLVIPNWLEPALQQSLLAEARRRAQSGSMVAARVGRTDELRHAREIRGDQIQWLETDDPADGVRTLLKQLDGMRQGINQHLFLGLVELESHFAHYPPGAHYQRHLDRFRSDDTRTLSAVVHLGDPWTAEHGGELRIFLEGPDGERSVDIAPIPGQLVLFLSAEVEHKVLPTQRDRYSIAGWMRRRPLS